MSAVLKSAPQPLSALHPDEQAARVRLAACYRVFAMLGWTEMIYNHITLRLPASVSGAEKQFLINPFGLHYSEVTASNLVKINLAGDVLDRANQFTQPRTIVLDTRFQGVPAVNLWVGYAVMVVDKQGGRRVVQGPTNLLLGYDETLEIIQLSTGKPKTTDKLIETVFLRVLNNKVGDICVVETSDHVTVTLTYSMRVNFEGEPARWFEVENYVKFLCDHVRSVLKGAIKKVSIEAFYGASVEIIRDTMLGKAGDGGARTGTVSYTHLTLPTSDLV